MPSDTARQITRVDLFRRPIPPLSASSVHRPAAKPEARYHPYSNVITRCVGASADVEPDTYEGDIKTGDLFLIASDGLTGMVDDRRLLRLLSSRATPQRLVEALISEANGRGGLDNITAIVVQVISLDDPPRDAITKETTPHRP